jgi:hypothetical protein
LELLMKEEIESSCPFSENVALKVFDETGIA